VLYRTHHFSIILYISFSIITKEEGHISGIVITQKEEDYEVVKKSCHYPASGCPGNSKVK